MCITTPVTFTFQCTLSLKAIFQNTVAVEHHMQNTGLLEARTSQVLSVYSYSESSIMQKETYNLRLFHYFLCSPKCPSTICHCADSWKPQQHKYQCFLGSSSTRPPKWNYPGIQGRPCCRRRRSHRQSCQRNLSMIQPKLVSE